MSLSLQTLKYKAYSGLNILRYQRTCSNNLENKSTQGFHRVISFIQGKVMSLLTKEVELLRESTSDQ